MITHYYNIYYIFRIRLLKIPHQGDPAHNTQFANFMYKKMGKT